MVPKCHNFGTINISKKKRKAIGSKENVLIEAIKSACLLAANYLKSYNEIFLTEQFSIENYLK
jgi:hypothetical protein